MPYLHAEARIPAAEVHIDEALVRGLLADQFPRWARLPLRLVPSVGLDNTIYRLGSDLAVRLPKRGLAAVQATREQQWLPILAAGLPLPVPVPLGHGRPTEQYPWSWSVCPWLNGRSAATTKITDTMQMATDLAGFITALQAIDAAGGPSGELRGVPLTTQDENARRAIQALRDSYDTRVLTAAWETALRRPEWSGPPVWYHGDLHPGNLLVEHGHLSAVVDFGLAATGDPACDLMAAWTCLPADARPVFHAALPVDDATWLRGQGWALLLGLMMTARAEDSPIFTSIGRHTITEVLADLAIE